MTNKEAMENAPPLQPCSERTEWAALNSLADKFLEKFFSNEEK